MSVKDGLEKLIKRRCTTIFIGALDSIEQKFGYQWGYDRSQNDLTEKEKLFFQLWKDLRKEILDKSNHQVKLLLNDLDHFEINMKRYIYNLEFNDE